MAGRILKDFFFLLTYFLDRDESCKHLYNTFTENTNEFIGCILVHNKNATFCTDCRPQFTNLFNAYKTLTQSKTCRTEFVEVNRLNLVDISWVNAQNIWDVAICSGEVKKCHYFLCRNLKRTISLFTSCRLLRYNKL